MIDLAETKFNNIIELDGISEVYDAHDNYCSGGKRIMQSICYSIRQSYKRITRMPITTVIFSGAISERYPGNLSRLIKKAKLGELMITNPRINPNSDNVIRVYVWTINKMALSKWFSKNRFKNEDDNE